MHYRDITVPIGAKRLVVVMTWDEPAASAGASRAVMCDLDLWADQIAAAPRRVRRVSRRVSTVDNVEYIVVNNPPAGTYRLQVLPIIRPARGPALRHAATSSAATDAG